MLRIIYFSIFKVLFPIGMFTSGIIMRAKTRCPATFAVHAVFVVMALIGINWQMPALANADCLGYKCTADGARSMLIDEVRKSRPDLLTGSLGPELDALFDEAVTRIGQRGFTPSSFEAAIESLRKIMADWPLGAEDVSARRLEQLRRGTHPMCPMWPFC